MNKLIFVLVPLIILSSIALADTEDFEEAEKLIKERISCEQLNDEQLEALGDYFMEQMHPGEFHEIMDERMGREGSATLKQVHINIARRFYCGDSRAMSSMMMNTMMGRYGSGSSMMYGVYYRQPSYSFYIQLIFSMLIIVLLLVIIIWLINNIKEKGAGNGRRVQRRQK